MRVEEILARLVHFDTTSHLSNLSCTDYIRDYLQGYGVSSEIIPNDTGDKACLWATVGTPNGQGVVLAGHTDVVPVEGQTWTSDPFTLTERDGKLFGRGSADMKGFLACALAFVPEFLAAKTGTCFHLAFTHDEETDLSGASHLASLLKERKIKPTWFWLGEPTSLSIIDEHKGCAAYKTRFTGVPGHSSQPDKGLNAIDLSRQFMNQLVAIQEQRKKDAFSNSRFDPPYTALNLGVIKGGTAENIIAEKCALLWQVRAHPGDSARKIRAEADAFLQTLFVSPCVAAFSQARVETETLFDIPPFACVTNNSGTKILQRFLKTDKTSAAGYATEAGLFQKTGSDVVVCGPGSVEQAHQPDEFVGKNELLSTVDLMRQVLLSSPA